MKQTTLEILFFIATLGLIIAVTMFTPPYINLWYGCSLITSFISTIIIIMDVKNEDMIQFAKKHFIKTLLFTGILGFSLNLTANLFM